jgi:hypothetical protein
MGKNSEGKGLLFVDSALTFAWWRLKPTRIILSQDKHKS